MKIVLKEQRRLVCSMNFSIFLIVITEVILYFVKKYIVCHPRRSSVVIMFLIVTIEAVKGNTKVFEQSASLKNQLWFSRQ
jgi:hypothetical protein